MAPTAPPLPDFLAATSRIGDEISVTGKWVPKTPGGRFRKSADAKEMLAEWQDIHAGARGDGGVLSTEVKHAIGEDAVLVHHVFANADALVHYFGTTATAHLGPLTGVAVPQLHLVRGLAVPTRAREAVQAKGVPVAFGDLLFGYVRDEYRRPDPKTAVQVTAKWTCAPADASKLDELEYWWQRVGTEAHSLEEGLVRFEAYRVAGEDALIIHETFTDTKALRFHLTKGTAEQFKQDIDRIAAPEAYYFRGPVAWSIRTYSKFMHLPATYTSDGPAFTRPGGSLSDGTTD